jgi:glycine betaine/proline transport system substrate-binding protein
LGLSVHAAADSAWQVKVQLLQSSTAEEIFQTLLASRTCKNYFDVQPIMKFQSTRLPVINGDANHGYPLGPAARRLLIRMLAAGALSSYVSNAAQGLPDRQQRPLKNTTTSPASTSFAGPCWLLFDTTGDGKVNMTGCNPGWGCEAAVEYHTTAYKLRDTVDAHMQGIHSALIKLTPRHATKRANPFFTTPGRRNCRSGALRPGKKRRTKK